VTDSKAVATQGAAAIVEKVVIEGDLSKLTPAERVGYYRQVCESLGVNPLTRPFDYITLNGKLTLYAKKDAADQLRKRDRISVTGLDDKIVQDVYVVKAQARTPDGRTDMATGAVSIKGLGGEALANAMLKAETKAKRRVTLSICGLGMLDETEVQDVADARPVHVDMATGEVQKPAPAQPAPQNGDVPFADFIANPAALRGFWAFVKNLNLTHDDVLAALNVQHLHEVTATVSNVKATLESFAKATTKPADKPMFAEGEQ